MKLCEHIQIVATNHIFSIDTFSEKDYTYK